jgi:hypothetical protein
MSQGAGLNGEWDPFTIPLVDVEHKIYEAVITALRTKEDHDPTELRIERKRIKAGLEARCVERVIARYRDRTGRCKQVRFVAKHLQGAGTREALVYQQLLRSPLPEVSPVAYCLDYSQIDGALLLLEDVPRVCGWPWRDVAASRAVLQRLAAFHTLHPRLPGIPEWDYECELQRSALASLEMLHAMRHSPEGSSLAKRGIRPLNRLALSLASRRAALLAWGPYGGATIHGDVHPGNVILRRRRGQNVPVLIDWGRARVGSALEDVSSWLQSLGYWEPEARKRHDTLLCDYLRAHGSEVFLSSDLRAAYWMAAASNALAGALRYHCWRATSATTVGARAAASHAAANWLRVIIRADALSS